MSKLSPTPVVELSEAELDALIERVEQAIAHHLALSVEDLQLLLSALLTLAHLHERLAENDMTLHKLRKLAGIVQRSEKLKHLTGAGTPSGENKPPRPPKAPPTPPAPAPEPVIHQHAQRHQAKASCRTDKPPWPSRLRCTHTLEGLSKGQRCPECARGTLYKYAPASFLRISGQTPLECTQHRLERLRCNTCGAYFTPPTMWSNWTTYRRQRDFLDTKYHSDEFKVNLDPFYQRTN